MKVQAWQVIGWPEALSTTDGIVEMAPSMYELGCTSWVDTTFGRLRYGQMVWGGVIDGRLFGLAWDWREVRPNVVALADPMTISSNLYLIEQGQKVCEARRNVVLASVIYLLPWQRAVNRPPLSDASPSKLLAA